MDYRDPFAFPHEWLTTVDRSLVETLRRWADKEILAKRAEHQEDPATLLHPALHSLFDELGLACLLWPEAEGGSGLRTSDLAMTMAAALEQVGRADAGLAMALADSLVMQASVGVEPHRDESRLQLLIKIWRQSAQPALAALMLPALAQGEQATCDDLFGLAPPAVLRSAGDGWRLRGEQCRPTGVGSAAGAFGVTALVESDRRIAFVLISAAAEGVVRHEPFRQTGLEVWPNARVSFRDVVVPEASLAFFGARRLRELLAWRNLACAAVVCGGLLNAQEILQDWGETRVIKGKGQIFKNNPLTASLMGEVGGEIAAARTLTYSLARLVSRPDLYGDAGDATIFTAAVNTARQVCRQAMTALNRSMELMASAGYATEWNLERIWRDTKTIEAGLGPSTAAQAQLARHFFASQTT
ncbi:MAG TPA: acyl-CoA dehydrogenase family protein [bacterium]|nr:acyl-CoA dehydrogenase family protein [bacterium]